MCLLPRAKESLIFRKGGKQVVIWGQNKCCFVCTVQRLLHCEAREIKAKPENQRRSKYLRDDDFVRCKILGNVILAFVRIQMRARL